MPSFPPQQLSPLWQTPSSPRSLTKLTTSLPSTRSKTAVASPKFKSKTSRRWPTNPLFAPLISLSTNWWRFAIFRSSTRWWCRILSGIQSLVRGTPALLVWTNIPKRLKMKRNKLLRNPSSSNPSKNRQPQISANFPKTQKIKIKPTKAFSDSP